MEISIVDATLCFDASGEPRLNLGDVNSGVGFASNVAMFGAGDGFIGIPNGPDGGSGAPQALMVTEGLYRYALAVRDPRIASKAGQLAEGDRAIVSNCSAVFLLTKASNTIGLVGKATGSVVQLEDNAGMISLGGPTGLQPVARVTDTVIVMFPPVIQVAGSLNGQPFVGVATITSPAVGIIQTGSSLVQASE